MKSCMAADVSLLCASPAFAAAVKALLVVPVADKP